MLIYVGLVLLGVSVLEGYMRRNDPENKYRPTKSIQLINETVAPIFYKIGSKLAKLLDIFKWIREFIDFINKYLPFEDIFNILYAFGYLIVNSFKQFGDGFLGYYQKLRRLNINYVLNLFLYIPIPVFVIVYFYTFRRIQLGTSQTLWENLWGDIETCYK